MNVRTFQRTVFWSAAAISFGLTVQWLTSSLQAPVTAVDEYETEFSASVGAHSNDEAANRGIATSSEGISNNGAENDRITIGASGGFMPDPLKAPSVKGRYKMYGRPFNSADPLHAPPIDMTGKKSSFGGEWDPDFAKPKRDHTIKIISYGREYQTLSFDAELPSFGAGRSSSRSYYGLFNEEQLPPRQQ
jgi:hypothetical protein